MDQQEEKKMIQETLEENLRINKEILEICIKLKKFMYVAQVYSLIKTVLIVIPIIIAIILFVPIFKEAFPQLKELLGSPDIKSLLE